MALLLPLLLAPGASLLAPLAHGPTSSPPAPASRTVPVPQLARPDGDPSTEGSVFATVVLANGTTLPGNVEAFDGIGPSALAYDPASQELYVLTDLPAGNVLAAWNLTLGEYVGSVPLATYVPGLLVDVQDQRVFLLGEETSSVLAYNASTLAYVGSSAVGANPYALAFDPKNDELFVSDLGSGNVTILDARSGAYVGSFPVAGTPEGIAYDPDAGSSGSIVIGCYGAGLAVYDIAEGHLVANVSVGSSSQGVVFDAADGVLAVSFEGYENVTVLNATNFGDHTSVPVPFYGSDIPGLGVGGSGAIYDVGGRSNLSVIDGADPSAPVVDLTVGTEPEAAVYDPSTADMLIADEGSNNLTVIDDGTHQTVGSVLLGTSPGTVAYAPLHDEYVVGASYELIVVNASTHLVTATIPIPFEAVSVADAGPLSELWVSEEGQYPAGFTEAFTETDSGSLAPIAGSLQSAGGSGPLAYDTTDAEMLLGDSNGSLVGIDPSTYVANDWLKLPLVYDTYTFQAASLAWDPENDGAYLTGGTDNSSVTVVHLAARTGGKPPAFSLAAQVPTGTYPEGIVYVPTTHDLYVADELGGNLTVIDPTTNSSSPGADLGGGEPFGIAYDTANGDLYVADASSGNVSVVEAVGQILAGPNLTVGASPEAVAYASAEQNISVANLDQGTLSLIGNLSAPAMTYTVTFTQSLGSELPAGTMWWVNVTGGGSYSSTSTTLSFPEPDGVYAYEVASANSSFTPSPSSSTFEVNGSGLSLSEAFLPVLYEVTFTESGLPMGTAWWVNTTIGGSFTSSGPTISFFAANGSYVYHLASANKSWAAVGGTFQVEGAVVDVSVTFTPVVFVVTVTETVGSELPAGTLWWFNLTGGPSYFSRSTVLTFSASNGTYDFTVASTDRDYTPSPGSGTFVVRGSVVSLEQGFLPVLYQVTVTESNLPMGTEWWLNVTGGSSFHAAGPTLTFFAMNGSYGYVIASENGSWVAPAGAFTVDGAVVSFAVTFHEVLYAVTFDDLPTSCAFDFGGQSYANGSMNASLLAGRYAIVAGSCSGEAFLGWSSSAGPVSSPQGTSTVVSVRSNGTLTAVWAPTSTAGVCAVVGPLNNVSLPELGILLGLAGLAGLGVAVVLGALTSSSGTPPTIGASPVGGSEATFAPVQGLAGTPSTPNLIVSGSGSPSTIGGPGLGGPPVTGGTPTGLTIAGPGSGSAPTILGPGSGGIQTPSGTTTGLEIAGSGSGSSTTVITPPPNLGNLGASGSSTLGQLKVPLTSGGSGTSVGQLKSPLTSGGSGTVVGQLKAPSVTSSTTTLGQMKAPTTGTSTTTTVGQMKAPSVTSSTTTLGQMKAPTTGTSTTTTVGQMKAPSVTSSTTTLGQMKAPTTGTSSTTTVGQMKAPSATSSTTTLGQMKAPTTGTSTTTTVGQMKAPSATSSTTTLGQMKAPISGAGSTTSASLAGAASSAANASTSATSAATSTAANAAKSAASAASSAAEDAGSGGGAV